MLKMKLNRKRTRTTLTTSLLIVSVVGLLSFSQLQDPWLWGPILGAIDEDSVMITWKTTSEVTAVIKYAREQVYIGNEEWEETIFLSPNAGVFQLQLTDLLAGTTYRYQVILYYGDVAYPSPIGRFTTSSIDKRKFLFLVYGNTHTFSEDVARVAGTMTAHESEAVFVIHTGNLIGYPAQEEWERFFITASELVLSRPLLTVIGENEAGDTDYYQFLSLPPGGGEFAEQWWSFSYGNILIIGLDSNLALHADDQAAAQTAWLQAELAAAQATFIIVVVHHPLFSSIYAGGENVILRNAWHAIFVEYGVDLVFSGYVGGYERIRRDRIHYIVTGGGGGPLIDRPEQIAPWTARRRWSVLHYIRVTIAREQLVVEAIPVAIIVGNELFPVPDGRPFDRFVIDNTHRGRE